jgi:putative glutamine amidotransferase
MKNRRPRIAITMRYDPQTERFYAARNYSEAVEAAGGLPVHIPLIPDRDYVAEIMKSVDGVLLPGSASDVDPLRYGHDPHPKLGQVHPLRDETDMLVLGFAEERSLPILAICYGIQILNVHRGGTLVQDIVSQLDKPIKHEQGEPRDRKAHKIRFQEGSRLATLAGELEVPVNSHHHQAIEKVGKNLVATAWSADGLVEGVEDKDSKFILGVQWHPEIGWQNDLLSQKIFKEFIASSAQDGSSR